MGKRWQAIAVYRSRDVGLVDVVHDIEELQELQQLIEAGPDWRSLESVTIRLARHADPEMTIEKAGEL